MNQIALKFEDKPITTIINETSGEPWWVADEVCSALGIVNPRDTLRKVLDDDERGVATVYTPGGPQQKATINEPGLYSLILRSRKPEAKRFKRWVTHEVLPQIRKTGSYGGLDVTALASAVASATALAMRTVLEPVVEALLEDRAKMIDALTVRRGRPPVETAPRPPVNGWVSELVSARVRPGQSWMTYEQIRRRLTGDRPWSKSETLRLGVELERVGCKVRVAHGNVKVFGVETLPEN